MRSKGKVERPFRTVKDAQEMLYHFHMPETGQLANDWLIRYLLRYNRQDHRAKPRSRIVDWIASFPPDGIRARTAWRSRCASWGASN